MEALAQRFRQTGHDPTQAKLEELESAPGEGVTPLPEEPEDEGVRKFRDWVRKRREPGD
jgi:hypothetical protein